LKFTVVLDRSIGRTLYRWHRHLYRLTRGVIGHKSPVGPMLILETCGRKSGQIRAVTLLYVEKDHVFYVVASNGARTGHPGWLLNVRAHAAVTVQVGSRRFPALAREIPAGSDPVLWSELVAHYHGWAEYQELTTRRISAVALTPED
jgi:deazaflavin-dependent oxidoreductase (nitroreductase family)